MVVLSSVDIRWLEPIVFFGVLPVLFAIAVHRLNYRGAMAPVLWLVSIGVGVTLLRDPLFDRAALWRLPLDHPHVLTILSRFVVLGSALMALGRWLTPEGFLWLPRNHPGLWAVFCIAYPSLSAVPQGIIWRVFFAQRYSPLLGTQHTLVFVGAAAFALAHLAFWNRTAIVVTAIGGALFLSTYLETHSMLLASAEHGAYGIVAFSSGLGAFLYRGSPLPRGANGDAAAARLTSAERS